MYIYSEVKNMPAERISRKHRAFIVQSMCEGMPVNGICRMTRVSKRAVLRVLQETGEACEDWHDRHFRDLAVERVEIDEQWAYVGKHKENLTEAEKQTRPDLGDCWLWASIDPDSKAILNWRTGKRTLEAAYALVNDLASRIPTGEIQVTTDALANYEFALRGAFPGRLHHATETKDFRKVDPGAPFTRRVDPLLGVKRKAVTGTPDLGEATPSHIERFFLTVRQSDKRTSRKTLAYSKLWMNHAFAASIHCFVYNMVRTHSTIKTTPAVALGLVPKRWTLENVVEMTEAYLKAKEEAAFEEAFKSKFVSKPKAPRRTYTPVKPKTPWYLDPESGGPRPDPMDRKPGIAYEDDIN
ncbi:MAG: hypothetical protein ABL994_17805 [Verrucomicrobiales bacterium]